jgi:hypothetical protein
VKIYAKLASIRDSENLISFPTLFDSEERRLDAMLTIIDHETEQKVAIGA